MRDAYRIEDYVTTVAAMLNDLQIKLLRLAVKGECHPEQKQEIIDKLTWLRETTESKL